PILCSLRPRVKPSMPRSTTRIVNPLCPASGSVRHTTGIRSALIPDEIKILVPLMIQSSPSRTALVRIPARSLPAPGSVIPNARMVSPEMMPGSHRRFCSSVVSFLKYGPHTSFCRYSAGATEPHLPSSSSTIALNRKSSDPPPPYSAGMLNPISPYSAAAVNAERSTRPSASHFSAFGATSRSKYLRHVSRNASCSSSKIRRFIAADPTPDLKPPLKTFSGSGHRALPLTADGHRHPRHVAALGVPAVRRRFTIGNPQRQHEGAGECRQRQHQRGLGMTVHESLP